jgi:hypothetical protein
MTSTVLQFPTAVVKQDRMKEELTELSEQLEETYQLLDQLHQGLHVLEKDSDEKEQYYDVKLKQYIDEVGIENIPTILLSYSSHVLCKANADDEITCEWLGDDEDA